MENAVNTWKVRCVALVHEGTVNSMTPDERADILNDINWMLEEKGYKYTVCGYEDKEEADMFIVMLQKDGCGNG